MKSTPINFVIWGYRMEQRQISMISRQLKRSLGERTLSDLGRATRFCRRERDITPFRLAVSLIDSFSGRSASCIADIQRGFNALCSTTVRYKPFHNQLAKKQFPMFMQSLFSAMLNSLAVEVLRFKADSPFAQFDHIRIQDGTSFALKPALADTFPGRFTTVSPAAVELHADLDLFSETANQIVLSPDSAAERQFLPPVETVVGGLLLADRGYFERAYFETLDIAGGHFIVRAGQTINPLIHEARQVDGQRVTRLEKQRLKAVASRLKRFDVLEMVVQFDGLQGPWRCRLVMHANLKKGAAPRYLITNLDAEHFNTEHVSDAYRLRWQVELLFKEWKSYANLRAFDTANPYIAEGLIWAALCAATLNRYCAHVTERLHRVAISTQTVAKCLHHVLGAVLRALVHQPRALRMPLQRALRYLADNATRAKPERDKTSGRLKLGIVHVHAPA
jgi:hypothetical protein